MVHETLLIKMSDCPRPWQTKKRSLFPRCWETNLIHPAPEKLRSWSLTHHSVSRSGAWIISRVQVLTSQWKAQLVNKLPNVDTCTSRFRTASILVSWATRIEWGYFQLGRRDQLATLLKTMKVILGKEIGRDTAARLPFWNSSSRSRNVPILAKATRAICSQQTKKPYEEKDILFNIKRWHSSIQIKTVRK